MTSVDWLAIEREYRAGQKSVNSIAKKHGIPETSLRRKAKKEGWSRDPAGTQREKVKAHFAGVANDVANFTARHITAAADRAIALEELALENAELALRQINAAFSQDVILESGDIKRLSESNQINLNTIRTIFTLNDPDHRDGVGYDDLPFPD